MPMRKQIARGTAAMDRVIGEKTDVLHAMHRDDLGSISFLWGEPGTPAKKFSDGSGVSHIVAARNAQGQDGEAAARHMVGVIAEGDAGKPYGPAEGQRVNIKLGSAQAVLSLFHFGKKETWLLTGWKEARSEKKPR